MNEFKDIKIIKSGRLKYDRLKSLSILRRELNDFGFDYTIAETKVVFEKIQNDLYIEPFDRKFKYCIDSIFSDNIYEELIEDKSSNCDFCFPKNYIAPNAP